MSASDSVVGRKFVCYWWFVGWDCLSVGIHVCWSMPNIEVHLPFGFVRFGFERYFPNAVYLNPNVRDERQTGWEWVLS